METLAWKADMLKSLGGLVLTDDDSVEKLSKDYYWYSPVLDKRLKEKKADVIIAPKTEEDVAAALALAYRLRIPVTARGAGTGNYGQAIPLEGGIVLDLSGLDRIVEFGAGCVRAQSGVRLGVLDKTAREQGQELRIYPSTYVKATVGGFVSGGSGGIGSVTWGNLWDGNVLEAVVYTLEEKPRRLVIKGDELYDYIHNYGTTGIMTEVTVPLAPRNEWTQCVFQFASFEDAVRYGEALARDGAVTKRLISPMEWPLPSFFKPLAKSLAPAQAAVLTEIAEHAVDLAAKLAEAYGGKLGHVIAASQYRKTIGVSDFTWNHTTLWAIKSDPSWTYLQAGFAPDRYLEQLRAIKSAYGDEVLFHFEWVLSGGALVPTALPVVRFSTEERLYEIIAFFKSVGVAIFDPHTWMLEDGGRGSVGRMRSRKLANDPLGLLNPGKL
ncbi:FAD-binding oxidoreductase [Paenibacillus sacheonensis]|uniref:FAD-binding protein n=1 Tax=Paenibacillus sacheonensis TaxID=742054 RepID=A0A7X4YLP8_9BACL|nr:FAD-binding oxidoreductase [Paenibacillus sacheonensis]MBM7566013.1 FAD/FMN-containing dehydrogenase [Paenibacillus sacheonensis]NBC68675.1 FAD-binding protein [Paenibacillus sacheonensis]